MSCFLTNVVASDILRCVHTPTSTSTSTTIAAILGLAFAAPAAQAHIRHHRRETVEPLCQTLTVVNQANVRPKALASVEFTVELQAEQLRAAWGTPCIQYGPGGWPVYLQVQVNHWQDGSETLPIGGEHYGSAVPGALWRGTPYAVVYTGAVTYQSWSYAFSHEIVEMLVDPNDDTYHVWPNGTRQLLEVCDPVENYTYQLDGVSVDDFTLPAAWSGSPGPYDEAGRLSAPLAAGYALGL